MEIGDWKSTGGLNVVYRAIRDYGLESNLAEFHTYGFTVIPPEKVGTPDLFDRMRTAFLRVATERTGVEHTLDGDAVFGKLTSRPQNESQFSLYYLLTEDESFREAAVHPVIRQLLHIALGPVFQLSGCAGFVKSRGKPYGESLGLHADAGNFPDPLPAPGTYSHVCQTNWILTDYTAENGPLCVVPGSHRRCRRPKPGEGEDEAVPVEAPVGSVIIFHGNLWHGGLPKSTDGLRLATNIFYIRPYGKTQEDYRGVFTEEELERHGDWFKQLVGEYDGYGWKTGDGPDPEKYFVRRTFA